MRSKRFSVVLIALSTLFIGMPAAAVAVPTDQSSAAALGFDLESATIPDLQQRMNHGRLTAVQLTIAYERRIDALDGKIHSVIARNQRAVAEAAASDLRHRLGRTLSPLDGIPVLLKDNV